MTRLFAVHSRSHAGLLAQAITLLVAGLLVLSGQQAALGAETAPVEQGVPWIQSDQPDYAPGAAVHLEGGNWQPGENVHLYVNDDQGRTWERSSDVVASDTGLLAEDFNLPDWFVATYQVTATGDISGTATTSFTDSNVQVSVLPAGTTAVITGTFFASSQTCTGTGVPSSAVPGDVPVASNQSLRLEASPTASGGLVFKDWSSSNGKTVTQVGTTGRVICVNGDNNGNGAMKYEATYQTPAAAATTLTASNATGSYGGTTSLSATLRRTSDSSVVANKSVSFKLNGASVGSATTNASGVATLSGVSLVGIDAGTYAGGVAASFAGDAGFAASSGAAGLTVTQAPLQLRADDKTKTYGDANPALTYSVSGLVGSDTRATALTAEPSLGTAPASANAGSYPITLSGGTSTNYSLTRVNGTLVVDKAQLVSTADDKARAYGDDNPTLTISVSGLKNGDSRTVALPTNPTAATTATTASPIGSYPITLSGGATSANYTLTRMDGTLVIGKRALTVTASPKTKVYGEDDPALTYTISSGSLASGDSVTGSLTRDLGQDVGSYAITQGTLSAGPNYVLTYQGSALTITKAQLTVTVKDDTKVYGAANPEFDVTYAGFVDDEGPTVLGGTLSFVTLADSATGVGSYDVTASGLTSSNYAVTFKKGTLAVTPAHLTVTVKPASKVYGSPNPAFAVSYTGFVNEDDESDLGGNLAFDTAASPGSAVGQYDVTASGLTSANYDIAYEKNILTIGQRAITVTADAQSKTYGHADPPLTYNVTEGSLAGDDAFTGGLGRELGQAVGTYEITQGDLALGGNYALSFVGAELVIGKRAVAVTADGQSKTYGEADPALTYTITDGSLAYADAFTGALTRQLGQSVGSYEITQGDLALDSNYDLTYVGAKLTIGKRAVEVTADGQSKTYGEADPALTYTITDGSLAYADAFTGALTRQLGQSVGSYEITQGDLALDSNYDLTYVGAKLTVGKRAVEVTADGQSKTYGEADPALTYTITDGSLAYADAFTGALTRQLGQSVGSYEITQGDLALDSNYDLTYVGAKLTVGKRAVEVTADGQSKTYGEADPALTYTITDGSLAYADAFTGTLTRAPGHAVGEYAITQGTLALDSNYDLSFVGAKLTVGKRAVEVTAEPQTKTYGEADPALTYTITDGSLAYADAFTGTLTRAPGHAVGEYAITQGTLALDSNYDLSFVGAKLTVGKRAVEVTAEPQTKTYGNADPALTYTITDGSLAYSDTFTGALDREPGQTVGSYEITQGDLALNGNYDLSFVGAKLTVGKRAVEVKADFKSKTYGDADPALTYEITDGSLAYTDTFTGSLVRAAGSDVGSYAIGQGSLTLGPNYALTYVGDSLSITKRLLTVTADNQQRVLGAANPVFTGKVEGTQYTDQIVVTYTTTATSASPVGPYAIVPVVGANPTSVLDNYSLNKVNGTLSVMFAWDGFLQPVNDTAHDLVTESKFKLGQTIPVKFDLKNAAGSVVTQVGSPTFTRSDNLGSCDRDATLDTTPSVTPDGGTTYGLSGGHYQYNWSTKGLTSGEYRVFAHLADGSHQSVYICLTK